MPSRCVVTVANYSLQLASGKQLRTSGYVTEPNKWNVINMKGKVVQGGPTGLLKGAGTAGSSLASLYVVVRIGRH